MAEIVQLTTEHLREIREAIERLGRETQARFDEQSLDTADLRNDLRETRTALHGLSYLFNLQSGDVKAELAAIRERLDRLERERA
jgi:hypothetical protein